MASFFYAIIHNMLASLSVGLNRSYKNIMIMVPWQLAHNGCDSDSVTKG